MQTRREYLVSLGLASNGRGKFSTAAHEALKVALDGGMRFSDMEAEPKKAIKIKTVGPVPRSSDFTHDAVRRWALDNPSLIPAGMMPGDRGRVSNELTNLYVDAMKSPEKVDLNPSRRFPDGTTFVGNINGHRVVSDDRQICGGCGVSIGWCRCQEGTVRTVLTKYGRAAVTPS